MHTPANVTPPPANVTHIRALANRIRRQTTNRDILELIDFVLGESECPRCEEARLANRERQARHRVKRKSPVSP